MRCPKCGYVSFEYLDSCKKCSKDLFEFKEKAGIAVLEPAFLDLNQFMEGGTREDTSEEIGEEAGDMEFNEEAALMDEIAEEESPSQAENLLDSLDMGEESGIGMDLGEELEGGPDLTGDMEDMDLSLSPEAEGEEISLDFASDEGEISLEESPEIEVSAETSEPSATSGGEGEINLTMDEEDLGISLSPESEEEGIPMTTEEEEPALNLSVDKDEEETSADESPELEIALEEEGPSLHIEEEENASPEESGELDLSIDLEEDDGAGEDKDNDIEGEIDLMLEGLDDSEPEES